MKRPGPISNKFMISMQFCSRFNSYVTKRLDSAYRGAKYFPYIRASLEISKELECFQQTVFQYASTKLENLKMIQNDKTTRLKSLHESMEILTVDLNNEIKTLLNDIEKIVTAVYRDEIENLAVLVSGFQAPFYNDQAVLNLYKQHLIRYLYRVVCQPK